MFSGIDRVDSTLVDCLNMAEETLRHMKQVEIRKTCGKLEKAKPRLERMGPPPSGKPQDSSSKPAHKWTLEPTDISDPLFDQDFDQFMESLDNLEPYDDLKSWSDDVDLFMDAMSHSPHMADILLEETKPKKQGETSKIPERPSESTFDKPWLKKSEGLTPAQS
jgi:hypothetical protein